VHESTATDRSAFAVYTHVGSGSAEVSITVDLVDVTGRLASIELQAPGRTIMKATMTEVGRR